MTLVRELNDDDERYFNYFRMSKDRFSKLLRIVGPKSTHASTHSYPMIPQMCMLDVSIKYASL